MQMKLKIWNTPAEWQIFKDTHEAIIDQNIFDTVQRIRDGRRRPTPLGEMPILSGMVFCAGCGSKLYQVRCKDWTHDKEYMVCAKYRKRGKDTCTSHAKKKRHSRYFTTMPILSTLRKSLSSDI